MTDISSSFSSSFYLPNNTTVCTSTSIQFRRAGQQDPTRTLTAALKREPVNRTIFCAFFHLFAHINRTFAIAACILNPSHHIKRSIRHWSNLIRSTTRYDTIRDGILTCARKPTRVSLIYRTEPTAKSGKQKN